MTFQLNWPPYLLMKLTDFCPFPKVVISPGGQFGEDSQLTIEILYINIS